MLIYSFIITYKGIMEKSTELVKMIQRWSSPPSGFTILKISINNFDWSRRRKIADDTKMFVWWQSCFSPKRLKDSNLLRLWADRAVSIVHKEAEQKHSSLLGTHKELRLIVRYTRPLPKLGRPECSQLTAAHVIHSLTDACRPWGWWPEEENANFSVRVNSTKVVIVWIDHDLKLVHVIRGRYTRVMFLCIIETLLLCKAVLRYKVTASEKTEVLPCGMEKTILCFHGKPRSQFLSYAAGKPERIQPQVWFI